MIYSLTAAVRERSLKFSSKMNKMGHFIHSKEDFIGKNSMIYVSLGIAIPPGHKN